MIKHLILLPKRFLSRVAEYISLDLILLQQEFETWHIRNMRRSLRYKYFCGNIIYKRLFPVYFVIFQQESPSLRLKGFLLEVLRRGGGKSVQHLDDANLKLPLKAAVRWAGLIARTLYLKRLLDQASYSRGTEWHDFHYTEQQHRDL